MEVAVCTLSEQLRESGIIFWTSGNSGLISANFAGLYSRLFDSAGLEYLETIAWTKPGINFASARMSHIYRNSCYYPARQWEPILVYKKPGKMKKMSPEGKKYMLNFQADVWEINAVNNLKEKYDHPTVAPVEIPYRALHAYSKQGDIIVDPFAGSGTTLIAVEKAGLGRKAYLVEINPAFCDIIIDRWEKYTGKRARLIS
jgi:DNA modification methylase